MEKLKPMSRYFILLFAIFLLWKITMQQEIAQINLFKEAEENRKLKRELSTTITSNSACVTWVGTSGQKYWRDTDSAKFLLKN